MKRLIPYILLLLLFGSVNITTIAQHNEHDHRALKAQEVNSEHSLYHLDDEWTTHRDETLTLADFSGEPLIVVMFYGNCTDVCPILIEDVWRLYQSLNPEVREQVQIAAVTFDYKNDTPDVLRDYALKENLDLPNWHFMTGERSSIRHLAMMLGVQYRERSDGMFEHSNLITVLDRKGQIGARIEGLGQPVEEAGNFIESIYTTAGK
jgi:protein SCO1/2